MPATTCWPGCGGRRRLDGGDRDRYVDYAASAAGVTRQPGAGPAAAAMPSGDTLSASRTHRLGLNDTLTGDAGATTSTAPAATTSRWRRRRRPADRRRRHRHRELCRLGRRRSPSAWSTGAAAGGEPQGDTLAGIENLAGSAFDDTLTGDGGANRAGRRRRQRCADRRRRRRQARSAAPASTPRAMPARPPRSSSRQRRRHRRRRGGRHAVRHREPDRLGLQRHADRRRRRQLLDGGDGDDTLRGGAGADQPDRRRRHRHRRATPAGGRRRRQPARTAPASGGDAAGRHPVRHREPAPARPSATG